MIAGRNILNIDSIPSIKSIIPKTAKDLHNFIYILLYINNFRILFYLKGFNRMIISYFDISDFKKTFKNGFILIIYRDFIMYMLIIYCN